MAEEFLHDPDRHPTHHQMARKRVAKHVPADLAQTRSLADVVQRPPALVLGQHLTVQIAKHQLPPQVPVRLQDVPQIGTEFDLPRSPALWSTDYPGVGRARE